MDQSKGGHVHAFLLDEGTALTLIDTLFDTDARRIIDRIGSIGRSVEDLKHIVLTHAHRSHLGGDAIATYPVFGPGWPAFMLNPTQHRASLRRMAELDTAVLAVGHGDPLTAGAAERVRSTGPRPASARASQTNCRHHR